MAMSWVILLLVGEVLADFTNMDWDRLDTNQGKESYYLRLDRNETAEFIGGFSYSFGSLMESIVFKITFNYRLYRMPDFLFITVSQDKVELVASDFYEKEFCRRSFVGDYKQFRFMVEPDANSIYFSQSNSRPKIKCDGFLKLENSRDNIRTADVQYFIPRKANPVYYVGDAFFAKQDVSVCWKNPFQEGYKYAEYPTFTSTLPVELGSYGTVTCKYGTLVGRDKWPYNQVRCSSEGVFDWTSDDRPECKNTCYGNAFPTISGAKYYHQNIYSVDSGSEIEIYCDDRELFVVGSKTLYCNEEGKLKFPNKAPNYARCEEGCYIDDLAKKGMIVNTSGIIAPNEVVSVSCEENYIQVGVDKVMCYKNRIFDFSDTTRMPDCVKRKKKIPLFGIIFIIIGVGLVLLAGYYGVIHCHSKGADRGTAPPQSGYRPAYTSHPEDVWDVAAEENQPESNQEETAIAEEDRYEHNIPPSYRELLEEEAQSRASTAASIASSVPQISPDLEVGEGGGNAPPAYEEVLVHPERYEAAITALHEQE